MFMAATGRERLKDSRKIPMPAEVMTSDASDGPTPRGSFSSRRSCVPRSVCFESHMTVFAVHGRG